jgi:hypothetical protein
MLFLFLPVCALVQTSAEMKEILDRLTWLEEENCTLANEVHALREQLTASQPAPALQTPPPPQAAEPPADERLDD